MKDLTPPNAEEAEGFDGEKEIPENLAELIAAARKRVAAYDRDGRMTARGKQFQTSNHAAESA